MHQRKLGFRPWYQYVELPSGANNFYFVRERGKIRTQLLLNFLKTQNYLNNKKVLDIGSNAGLFCCFLAMNKNCKCIGIELSRSFYYQANFIKNKFKVNSEKLKLINGSIVDNLDIIYSSEVIIARKVLYHKNIPRAQYNNLINAIKNSKAKYIIVQGHTTQGEFGETEFIKNMLFDIGFEQKDVFNHDEYPIASYKRV